MRFHSILLIIMALAITAQAQPQPPIEADQAVANDDRGQAFIIARNVGPLSALGGSRKGAITEPQQYSIFLGSGWRDSILRARETNLGSLLANVRNDSDLLALQDYGIRNRFGPTASEERLDIAAGTLTDLAIQRMLADMLDEGTLPRQAVNAIYVVYLDPNLRSTLGGLISGKHYAAYHSTFMNSETHIRYVVVPFESDAAATYQIALRAFVAAALKPGGARQHRPVTQSSRP